MSTQVCTKIFICKQTPRSPPRGDTEISKNGHALPSATREPRKTRGSICSGIVQGSDENIPAPRVSQFSARGVAQDARRPEGWPEPGEAVGPAGRRPWPGLPGAPTRPRVDDLEHGDAVLPVLSSQVVGKSWLVTSRTEEQTHSRGALHGSAILLCICLASDARVNVRRIVLQGTYMW